jgi:hypothetical protein
MKGGVLVVITDAFNNFNATLSQPASQPASHAIAILCLYKKFDFAVLKAIAKLHSKGIEFAVFARSEATLQSCFVDAGTKPKTRLPRRPASSSQRRNSIILNSNPYNHTAALPKIFPIPNTSIFCRVSRGFLLVQEDSAFFCMVLTPQKTDKFRACGYLAAIISEGGFLQ